jgi:hypothetical protein
MSREGGLLCQGSVGQRGNFEVVVARVGGGFWTFWRANDVAGFPWHGPGLAMGSEGDVSDVVLIEDNIGTSELASVRREGTGFATTASPRRRGTGRPSSDRRHPSSPLPV